MNKIYEQITLILVEAKLREASALMRKGPGMAKPRRALASYYRDIRSGRRNPIKAGEGFGASLDAMKPGPRRAKGKSSDSDSESIIQGIEQTGKLRGGTSQQRRRGVRLKARLKIMDRTAAEYEKSERKPKPTSHPGDFDKYGNVIPEPKKPKNPGNGNQNGNNT